MKFLLVLNFATLIKKRMCKKIDLLLFIPISHTISENHRVFQAVAQNVPPTVKVVIGRCVYNSTVPLPSNISFSQESFEFENYTFVYSKYPQIPLFLSETKINILINYYHNPQIKYINDILRINSDLFVDAVVCGAMTQKAGLTLQSVNGIMWAVPVARRTPTGLNIIEFNNSKTDLRIKLCLGYIRRKCLHITYNNSWRPVID